MLCDDINGILRSNCTTHRMTVPMDRLDAAGEYKICYRIVNERKPYYSDGSDIFEYNSAFYPAEEETYAEWCRLLKSHVKPDMMICGHVHRAYVTNVGDEGDYLGQPCPVVVGSEIQKNKDDLYGEKLYVMTGIEMGKDNVSVVFQGSDGKVYNSFIMDNSTKD